MRNKGQAFMPDFLGSMIVFSVVISMFLFSWNTVTSNTDSGSVNAEIRQNAEYTTTFLVSTPGYPEDWNSSNVDIVGFAEPDHVIQPSKIEEFRNLSYDRQKELMEAQNFHLVFRRNGSVMDLEGEPMSFGEQPENPQTVIPVTRSVLVNDSGDMKSAEMRFIVWR